MNYKLNLHDFISKKVTKRAESLFMKDLELNKDQLAKQIYGKSILVIGGAGTIGSSFIKATLPYEPKKIIVVDHNENGLAELIRDLRSNPDYQLPKDLRTYPIDFGSEVFVELLKNEGKLNIVANFAAHKHVRSEKDIFSIKAMLKNNVFNSHRLLNLLSSNPPDHFFAVSTDKAANPVNVMGASKKLMEQIILSFQNTFKVSTARFANVAFSNGSLPDAYLKRIEKGQPLTSPKDIKRYFISPTESGQLCLLACVLSKSGNIFFPKLDMTKELKTFTSIAEDLLAQLGFQPEYTDSENEAKKKSKNLDLNLRKYPVYFFASKTSGEKSFEEFYTTEEDYKLNQFNSLGVISTNNEWTLEKINKQMSQLKEQLNEENLSKEKFISILSSYVTSFQHIEKGKNLDQSM